MDYSLPRLRPLGQLTRPARITPVSDAAKNAPTAATALWLGSSYATEPRFWPGWLSPV